MLGLRQYLPSVRLLAGADARLDCLVRLIGPTVDVLVTALSRVMWTGFHWILKVLSKPALHYLLLGLLARTSKLRGCYGAVRISYVVTSGLSSHLLRLRLGSSADNLHSRLPLFCFRVKDKAIFRT
jgi:hypothetical protein